LSRILTTHVGSLPRPHALLDAMKAKLAGNAPADYDRRVRDATAECVRQQAEVGIDIVSDGEQSRRRAASARMRSRSSSPNCR